MTALHGFAPWAGLFMQIAGVLESMRRLAANPAAFTINPVVPTMGMGGSPFQKVPDHRLRLVNS